MSHELKILHVTECYAGGVRTAVNGYASLDLPVENHIIQSARRHPQKMSAPDSEKFVTISNLPESHLGAVRAVIRVVKEVRPDVIHAHSSFGGVYGRLAGLITRIPVVYTPHGLSFERRDISKGKRRIFRIIERLFAPLSTVQAGCATYETELLAGLSKTSLVRVIPNAIIGSEFTSSHASEVHAKVDEKKITFTGRITEARHPEMAMEIATLLKPHDIAVQWIGDGDPESKKALLEAGVDVTGWLAKDEMQQALQGVDVAIHTARWDGFPMVILEMLAAGIPLLVEDISALQECPAEVRFDTAEQAVQKILQILEGDFNVDWSAVKDLYNEESQARSLLECYRLAANKG